MRVCAENPEPRQLTVLDTVDWAIWMSGQVLVHVAGNGLELYDRDDQLSVAVPAKRWPSLIAQLKDPLFSALKPLVSVRALLPQFNSRWQEQPLAFLNSDDKIVARATLYHLVDTTPAPPSFLKIHALRGYNQEVQALVNGLNPVTRTCPSAITRKFLLQRCGLNPNPPATKPGFHVNPDLPTAEIVLRMVAELLSLARQQEEGLIADIDSEFTHQYRVNLRKGRSLLSLFKKELTPQLYCAIQKPLKSMAKTTNQLRDLDVFLLDQDGYRAMLPAHFHPGLEGLFKRLRGRRRKVWCKVTATLKQEEYLETAQQLEQRLKEPPDLSAPRSGTAIKKRVSRKILSQYRKIKRHDARIDATTPDDRVHEVRIEAKKLRYLLELFAELFAYDQVRQLIKALKKLQDNLGRFNDYSSQCLFLESLLRGAGIKTAERDAISGLIAVLYSKQQHERGQVVDMIAAFSDTEIAEQFQKLFTDAAAQDGGS
ncbi:MAG: CHAD domain-containing protein [Desulfuromonadales bacterium]|nr:CHAD domain-containing protein [Desulfuromonadales bacterium]